MGSRSSPQQSEEAPLYSITWQVQSSLLTLRRETARQAMAVVRLQVAANRQKLAIAETAAGRPVSIDELETRAAHEAAREPAKKSARAAPKKKKKAATGAKRAQRRKV